MIPFGFYFLLSVKDTSWTFLRNWQTKASIIFLLMSTGEILHYFGIYALAVTFDPLDFVAYGVGTMIAVLFDVLLFPRIFSFWELKRM